MFPLFTNTYIIMFIAEEDVVKFTRMSQNLIETIIVKYI